MQVSGAKLSVTNADDLVEIRYTIVDSEVESGGHLCVGALAYLLSVMIEMCGSRCRAVSADLPIREPIDKTIFVRAFGKNLKFDCPEAVIRFGSVWMRKAPLCAKGDANSSDAAFLDDEMLESIQAACVRQSLQGVVPSITNIASQMGWSKRTLSRRLKERGTSFDEIRQKSIFGAAIRLLNDTDMSVTAIATSLGYAEIASFTRAFHSWTGYPPTQVRQKRNAPQEM
jgi:AraC-like DNA-binding protein